MWLRSVLRLMYSLSAISSLSRPSAKARKTSISHFIYGANYQGFVICWRQKKTGHLLHDVSSASGIMRIRKFEVRVRTASTASTLSYYRP